MSTKRFRRRILAGVAAILLVATACAPSTPSAGGGAVTSGAVTPTTQAPVAGGRIIDSSFSDAQRLNPAISNDAVSTRINTKIYETLVQTNPKTGVIEPWMGQWTLSPDGLLFSWTIDPKAVWSDGKPVIGNDFLARVKLQGRSKITPNKSVFNDIEGYQDYSTGKATSISGIKVDPTDPKKFTVKFTRIFCPALPSVFGSAPMPEHIFGKYINDADISVVVDTAPENSAPPVSSGPFKFKEWRKGDQVILTRNDTYFKGKPYLDEYVMKVVADSTVQAAQLKTGEVTYGLIQPGDVANLQSTSSIGLTRWPNNGYVYIGWRVNNPNVAFLQDKRIRQALQYGINIDEVVKAVLFGEGTKMVSHHPPVSWAAGQNLNQYGYDRARAETLIKEAGYAKGADGVYAKDGKPLAITLVTNQGNKTRETFLQVAVEQYKQIGVKINPKLEAFESLVPKLTGGSPEVEAIIIGWALSADPDPFTIWHSSNVASPTKSGNNFVGYSNPRIDALIEQGRNGPNCSQQSRATAYQEFNKILNDDVPYMFGFAQNSIAAADKRIQGIVGGPFGNSNGDHNIHEWWIKP